MSDNTAFLELQIALQREQISHLETAQKAHTMRAELLRYEQRDLQQQLAESEKRLAEMQSEPPQ